jgi:hypothetical protein
MMINKIYLVIAIVLFLFCDKPEQSAIAREEKPMDTIASTAELTIDDIIAFELKWVKGEYESKLTNEIFRSYRLPSPDCEQCSGLEQLLVYEKILDYKEWGTLYFKTALPDKYLYTPLPTSIKGASYFTGKDDEIMKHKLKDIEVEFEKKFKQPTPWWWICSVEERIKRLEEINKAGKLRSYSFAVKNRGDYRMGKTLATYEMWFKRPFTEGARCGDMDRLKQAEKALDVGLPYLSEKEYIELNTKLKTEYQKRYRISMPDYWCSVARVYYNWKHFGSGCSYHILVTRTVLGSAVAREVSHCMDGYRYYSLELDMRDWLDFINALNKLGVSEWEIKEITSGSYDNFGSGILKIFILGPGRYGFDGDWDCVGDIKTHEIIGGIHVLPPNWKKVGKVVEDMKTRIEKYGKEDY